MNASGTNGGGEAVSRALLKELSLHPSGLSALELAGKGADLGFPRSDVERAIRRAIDEGDVGVGADLELRIPVLSKAGEAASCAE